VRLSTQATTITQAIAQFTVGNALPLLRLMPTSALFGFWDSRGTQGKHARILLARIDAFDVVPCTRHALYSGPYSKDDFAKAILNGRPTTEAEKNKMAEKGFTNAPSEGLGGVIVQGGRIERLALLSLTDLARIFCSDEDGTRNETCTNAARRYLFALGALAEGHARASGSHRLRSGCELVSAGDTSAVVDLRGGTADYPDAEALKELFLDRDTLVLIATNAKSALGIPNVLEDFTVTIESLRADLGEADPTQLAAKAEPESETPQQARRKRQ
jgi:CRISPR-associated protein Csb1